MPVVFSTLLFTQLRTDLAQLKDRKTKSSLYFLDSGIEWYLRARKKFKHKPTGTVYHWPPKELITIGIDKDGNPVENGPQWIGASLIPSGFIPPQKIKLHSSKEWHYEWQWEFVRMEHLLLKTLNHPQMRFFLFITLMFRSHLSESTKLDFANLRYLLAVVAVNLWTN